MKSARLFHEKPKRQHRSKPRGQRSRLRRRRLIQRRLRIYRLYDRQRNAANAHAAIRFRWTPLHFQSDRRRRVCRATLQRRRYQAQRLCAFSFFIIF